MHIHPQLEKVKKLPAKLRPYRLHISIGLGGLLLLAIVFSFLPQTISYDFGRTSSCRVSPRLFPDATPIQHREPFNVYRPASLSIGGFDIYANTVCATIKTAPAASSVVTYSERLFGLPFLGHSIRVTTPQFASVDTPAQNLMLPPEGIWTIKLNQADTTFDYVVQLADKTAPCTPRAHQLDCKLAPLQLAYAQAYDLKLVRTFKQRAVSTVSTTGIKTLTPISLTNATIAAGAHIQQKPTDVIIQTDKKLTQPGTVALILKNPDGTETPIPVSAQLQDTAIRIVFGAELPRKASFEVRLSALMAEDGSGLVGDTFTLPFTTTGGPRITGANFGSQNVSTNQTIVLTTDQPLLPTQNIAAFVGLNVQGKPFPAHYSISGNKITIAPQAAIPLCAPFTVKVTNQVLSQYGISGDSAWSRNSRTICYTTFSIGTSVRGRAITAYQFGSGPNPIIYMGAMHGSEYNSKNLMEEWFRELNANPGKLPARSLVVIPAVSPDGIASNSRLNANNVDLNRNFPAADWKSVVTSPTSPQPSPAGGPSPLSEPESRAVASYIQRTQPRLVFSFHSAAGIVEANEAGDSVSIASGYASRARYRAVPKSQSAPVFKYDTTGAMEDWMRDRLGRPAVVVELVSRTSSEFSRNRSALWYTTGL